MKTTDRSSEFVCPEDPESLKQRLGRAAFQLLEEGKRRNVRMIIFTAEEEGRVVLYGQDPTQPPTSPLHRMRVTGDEE